MPRRARHVGGGEPERPRARGGAMLRVAVLPAVGAVERADGRRAGETTGVHARGVLQASVDSALQAAQ